MSNLKINKCEKNMELPKICDLDYGTFVTDVPSGNDCVYIKVKKKSRERCHTNKGLGIIWDNGNCVLLNITYGTLRQIPAKTRVMPLKPELTVTDLDMECYYTVKKHGKNDYQNC